MKKSVLVVGGGVSGIVVADALTQLGASVIVVEKDYSIGGMLRHLRRQLPHDNCRFCTSTISATSCLRLNAKKLEGINTLLLTELTSVERHKNGFLVTVNGAEEKKVKFNAIVLATGINELSSEEELRTFRYSAESDVLTALELERFLTTSSEMNRIITRSDGTPTRSVAFICCVGSRRKGRIYCSATCCSYGLRQFHALKELIPALSAKFFFTDLRVYDKMGWRYALTAFSNGLQPIRCRIARLERDEDGLFLRYEDGTGRYQKEYFDKFVLLTAQVPNRGIEELFRPLGVGFDEYGFILTSEFSTSTDAEGVFACGCATGPKSISDSIVEALATASDVAVYLRLKAEGRTVVFGDGISALTAAYQLAENGLSVHLITRGHPQKRDGEERRLLLSLKKRLKRRKKVESLPAASIKEVKRYADGYRIEILTEERKTSFIYASAVILALDGKKFSPLSKYPRNRRLIQLSKLKRLLLKSNSIKSVAVVLCEGAFTEEHPYCGRECCHYALRTVSELAERSPNTKFYLLMKEINSYGLYETLYYKAREAGVLFLRYPHNTSVRIKVVRGGVLLRYYDTVLYETKRLEVDVVAFGSFTTPPDLSDIIQKFNIDLDGVGFVEGMDAKFHPTLTRRGRIFACGDALHPQELKRKILESKAVSASATVIIKRQTREPLSYVLERRCSVCGLCVEECPFGARVKEHRGIVVDGALCIGCGICVSVCPSGASRLTGTSVTPLPVMERG